MFLKAAVYYGKSILGLIKDFVYPELPPQGFEEGLKFSLKRPREPEIHNASKKNREDFSSKQTDSQSSKDVFGESYFPLKRSRIDSVIIDQIIKKSKLNSLNSGADLKLKAEIRKQRRAEYSNNLRKKVEMKKRVQNRVNEYKKQEESKKSSLEKLEILKVYFRLKFLV
jgi:hypothetical protein